MAMLNNQMVEKIAPLSINYCYYNGLVLVINHAKMVIMALVSQLGL
jgi:hypothetical protein